MHKAALRERAGVRGLRLLRRLIRLLNATDPRPRERPDTQPSERVEPSGVPSVPNPPGKNGS